MLKQVGLRLLPRTVSFFPISSVFSEEKVLSIAALSHILPYMCIAYGRDVPYPGEKPLHEDG